MCYYYIYKFQTIKSWTYFTYEKMNIINGVICYLVVERVMGVLNGEGRQALTAYNVVTNNCEHFVSWARNGWALSHQVKNITEKCLSVS